MTVEQICITANKFYGIVSRLARMVADLVSKNGHFHGLLRQFS